MQEMRMVARTPLFYAFQRYDTTRALHFIEKGGNLQLKDNCNVSIFSFFIENCIFGNVETLQSFPSELFQEEHHLDGYEVVRKDRSRNGGGVCIYLPGSINYKIRSDLIPPELEAVCLEITKPQSKPFIVTTIYRPPNANAEFFDHLEKLIKQIDDENKEMYILGDLNCNLLGKKYLFNMQTNKLNSLYELYQLSQLINEPTRVTMTTSSLIDHVVTNTPEKISHSGVVHTGISDHSLVYAIRKFRVFQKTNDFVEIRNMKNFNEKNFCR